MTPFWMPFLMILTLGVATYWWTPWGRRGRWVLVGLRWAFLLILLGILLRPTRLQTEFKTFPGSVLILADTSRSMGVRDESGEQSRFEAMRDALGGSSSEWKHLTETVNLHAWTFDQTVRTMPITRGQCVFPAAPEGERTALGAALADVLQQTAGEKILGVILASDGAQRSLPPRDALPQTAILRMKRQGIPLYTLCFGRSQLESRTQDVAVEDLIADQRVFIDTELVVSGSVRVDGLANTPILVELVVDGGGRQEVVGTQTIQATKPSETFPVAFSWTPRDGGEYKLFLRSPVRQEELSKNNNQLAAFVNVLKGGVSVLYLEGAFRPEMSFLRRALNSSLQIQMEVLRLSTLSASGQEELKKRLQNQYSAVILGDVDASCFAPSTLQLLADKVSAGMGLLTLGGFQTYGPGGYAETPLAKVLPMEMDKLERQPLDEPLLGGSRAHWNEPLAMRPTPAGISSSVLTLALRPEDSARRWEKLPLLDGANRFLGVKPSAVVLADAETLQDGKAVRVPLLLEQAYGAGRVLSFAADSTWRWWLGGFEDDMKTFWRQAVLWLAKKDNVVEGNVAITMPQRRFSQEQEIPFAVVAKLSSGETLLAANEGARSVESSEEIPMQFNTMADWHIEVEHPDGHRTPVKLVCGTETMRGTLPKAQLLPGDYTLYATVTHLGQHVGDARCRFLVFHENLEMDNVQAEPKLLESLAVSSGGHVVRPEELGTLWKTLADKREALRVEQKTLQTLWDRWPWLAVLLTLLCVEWWVRKRQGLV